MQSLPLGGKDLKHPAPIKLGWLDRAIQVYNYHVNLRKSERNWTIEKTAEALQRSIGSVSNDITVATWSITHEKQLRRFRSMRDALAYIKEKKDEMKDRVID
jgi:hypothetical protein